MSRRVWIGSSSRLVAAMVSKGLALKLVESGQRLERVSQWRGVSLRTRCDWVKDRNEKKRLA